MSNVLAINKSEVVGLHCLSPGKMGWGRSAAPLRRRYPSTIAPLRGSKRQREVLVSLFVLLVLTFFSSFYGVALSGWTEGERRDERTCVKEGAPGDGSNQRGGVRVAQARLVRQAREGRATASVHWEERRPVLAPQSNEQNPKFNIQNSALSVRAFRFAHFSFWSGASEMALR